MVGTRGVVHHVSRNAARHVRTSRVDDLHAGPTLRAEVHDGDKVPEHTSDALAVKVAVARCDPVHSSVGGVGQVIDGFVVSATRTVVVQLAGFAAASCARQVTVVLPRANPEPDIGLQPSSTAMPQLSLRLGPANETGVVAPEHSTAAGVEQVIDGPVLSTTVTSAPHI